MSSFPQHVDNIRALKELGFNVDDCFDEDSNVTMELWSYDDLVYLMDEIICKLKDEGYGKKQLVSGGAIDYLYSVDAEIYNTFYELL